ncbi:MAG: hypothetical protein RJQ09_04985 [Cyclobacteriaceae bacterium]
MTKLNTYLMRFLAVAVILMAYSCGTDDDDDDDDTTPVAPTISVSSSDFDDLTLTATGKPGDVVTATINITAAAGFNTMTIEKVGGETSALFPITESRSAGATQTTFSYSFSYTLLEAEVDETVSFGITAVDDQNQTASETLTLITEAIPETPARAYSAVLLAAPLGDFSSKTFFSTSTGETYSASDVTGTSDPISATIDFGFYFGTSTGSHLASPASFEGSSNAGLNNQVDSWGTLNSMIFKTTAITSSEFIELTSFEDIDAAFDAGTDISDPDNIDQLAVGDVVAFETDSDKDGGAKKGLALVVSLVEANDATGQIELEILVQEEPN